MNDHSRNATPSVANARPALPLVGGIHWPRFWTEDEWGLRLEALANWEPRPDDVFVISFPKSGHHWSHDFLSMIINGDTNLPNGKSTAD